MISTFVTWWKMIWAIKRRHSNGESVKWVLAHTLFHTFPMRLRVCIKVNISGGSFLWYASRSRESHRFSTHKTYAPGSAAVKIERSGSISIGLCARTKSHSRLFARDSRSSWPSLEQYSGVSYAQHDLDDARPRSLIFVRYALRRHIVRFGPSPWRHRCLWATNNSG